MIVKVKLFAALRQASGQDAVDVQLPPEATVAQLRAALLQQHPALSQLLGHVLFAVNAEYANDSSKIPSGAEVACIPPVSGG